MKTIALSRVAEINPRKPASLATRRGEQVPFLAMADVSVDGTFALRQTRALAEVLDGYTYFAPGDVLVARITPCLENGKASHVAELPADVGFGSTEFHVVRPGPELDGRFVFHLLWSAGFRRVAAAHMRGSAGQKRVPDQILARTPVPLMSIARQRRVAAILDRADAVRRKRRRLVALTESLLRSSFVERFGDPVQNPRRWPLVTLAELCAGKPRNGLSPSRRGRHPGKVLSLAAVTRGRFDAKQHKSARFEHDMPRDKRVSSEDLLVCRGNGNLALVGRGRFAERDYPELLFPDTMIGVPVDFTKVTRAYLEQAWNGVGVRRQIEQRARTTNGIHKINQGVVRSIVVPLPPISEQQRFDAVAERARRIRASCEADAGEVLFQSLVQRAFRGEL